MRDCVSYAYPEALCKTRVVTKALALSRGRRPSTQNRLLLRVFLTSYCWQVRASLGFSGLTALLPKAACLAQISFDGK